jgi:hypothetical protein
MKERFEIVLEGDDRDVQAPEVRLRQALKMLLRAFRLRCTRASRVDGGDVQIVETPDDAAKRNAR